MMKNPMTWHDDPESELLADLDWLRRKYEEKGVYGVLVGMTCYVLIEVIRSRKDAPVFRLRSMVRRFAQEQLSE